SNRGTGDRMGVWSDFCGEVKSVASDVTTFVCESRAFKRIASAVVLVAGIALTVCTGGLAAGVGQMLIAGGASMMMTSLMNKKVSWADVGKSFLKGAVIGLVTMGFSSIATSMFARFATGLIGKGMLTIGSSTICSVLTNGASNLMGGKKFFDGWKRAAILGFCIGGISAVASAGTSYVTNIINKNIANENANVFIRGLSSIKELSAAYQNAVSSLGAGWQSAIGAASAFAMGFGQNVLMQLMFENGHVSWKAALACALIAGTMGAARAGMNARRRDRKDTELIEKALEDHEQGGTTDKTDATNGPNEKVKDQPGCTVATRNEKNGNVEYGESTGKRAARVKHEPEEINTRDFPDKHKVKYKVAKQGIEGFTNEEADIAREQNPPTKSGGQKVFQRPCSEVDSFRKQKNFEPSALPEDMTNVTIATGPDRNGNTNVRFAPPCKVACAHNPGRSLSTQGELSNNLTGNNLTAQNVLDAQTATSQAHLITEYNRKDSTSSDRKSGNSGSGGGGPGSEGGGPGSGG
ncbi:hypothetical protein PENTCL1PPCAC_25475, partial [Pristionchus entomophagus]